MKKGNWDTGILDWRFEIEEKIWENVDVAAVIDLWNLCK